MAQTSGELELQDIYQDVAHHNVILPDEFTLSDLSVQLMLKEIVKRIKYEDYIISEEVELRSLFDAMEVEGMNLDTEIEELNGKSLLHHVQSLESFKYLLNKGADIFATDKDGNTVWDAHKNNEEIAEYIKANYPELTQPLETSSPSPAIPDSYVGAIAKELQEKTGLEWGVDGGILTLSLDDEKLLRDLNNIAVRQNVPVDIKNSNILRIHGLNKENLDKLDNVVDLDNLDNLDSLGEFIASVVDQVCIYREGQGQKLGSAFNPCAAGIEEPTPEPTLSRVVPVAFNYKR